MPVIELVKVKDPNKSSKKWVDRASVADGDYKDGVMNPRKDWASATTEANDAWKKGTQEAISQNRFVGGVRKAGTQKWQEGASLKGADRYASGVRAAQAAYEQAAAENAQVLSGVSLPTRGPRGDPRNYERVKAVGEALHKAKLARKRA